MQRLARYFARYPRKLFLVDGLGALISATGLLLLKRYNVYFGLPRTGYEALIPLALFCSLYSFFCAAFAGRSWPGFLPAVVAANLVYCGLLGIIPCIFYRSLSALGWSYLGGEIIIILTLVTIERRTLRTGKKSAGAGFV